MKRFWFIFSIIFLFACQSKQEVKHIEPTWTQEQSTSINKKFSQEEEIKIKLFLKHHDTWKTQETGTGLRYWIYEDKEGEPANAYDNVDVKFEVRLLNDSLLYKTAEKEVSHFKVDKSDVESGVMEGIKYMSEGDKAKFIIPSHIGHGLLGDFYRIPPLEILLVDIELVRIYRNEN